MKNLPSQLLLTIAQEAVNGFQSTEWFVNQELVLSSSSSSPLPTDILLNVTLPCCIQIYVSGKNLNTDTIIVNDTIIQDKFIKIQHMSLDRIPIKNFLLHRICKFTNDNGQSCLTNFWGQNGIAEISFDAPSAIVWHMTKNY